MALTPAQLATLKANILAAGDTAGLRDSPDGRDEIARLYNLTAAPDFYVWRTSVAEAEFVGTAGVDVANAGAATNWSWVGAGFITRSQGERDAWNRLFMGGSCNPSLANVRQALADILSGGTAPAPANRNHLLVIAKRKATRAEKLFATGTGSFAPPAMLVVEGAVTFADIDAALNLP